MKELEVYIHIPFCVKKCNYCDFLSFSAKKELLSAYHKALITEIKAFFQSEEYLSGNYQISTIFIGGGTPSILNAEEIAEILSHIPKETEGTKEREVTIETNPGTLCQDKLRIYRQSGINRLSLGLQSSDNKDLKLLGRIHTWEQFLENYNQARLEGFENINIDLMSGLPGQTTVDWEKILRDILKLSPEHISAYSLILEKGTPFYDWYKKQSDCSFARHPEKLPSEEETATMYEQTEKILLEEGYQQYEISNYSKPGKECHHNLGYWYRTEYIGFGLGASSLLSETRFQNTSNISEYISITAAYGKGSMSRQRDFVKRIHKNLEFLTRKAQIEETMFLGMRCRKGVSSFDFFEKFGEEITDIYENVISKYLIQGFLEWKGEYLRLTRNALLVSNRILQDFLLD